MASNKKNYEIKSLNHEEIQKLINIIKEEKSLFSIIIGCILNTGHL